MNVVFSVLGDSPASEFYVDIKFRRRGITQQKEYNNKFQLKFLRLFITYLC
jgi:hypothetical protein